MESQRAMPKPKPQFSFEDYDNVIGFVVSQAGYRLSQALAKAIESLGSDLRPRHLSRISHVVPFEQLPQAIEAVANGKARGRTVIDVGSAQG